VETLRLQTLYVLFFIELGTRRVHFAGVTAHPNQHWVTQQARQMVWKLEASATELRVLIHDNDRKFTSAFDTIFETEAFYVFHTLCWLPFSSAPYYQRKHTVKRN